MLRTILSLCLLATASTAAFSQAAPKKIYLTFDDGPQPGTTDVLDVLKEEGAAATFFLTGTNAGQVGGEEGQAKIILRTIEEGHDLGNHCFVHKPMTKADYTATYGDLSQPHQRQKFAANYSLNETAIGERIKVDGFKFHLARLPGDGSRFPHLVAETEKLGMKHFHWANEFAIKTPGAFQWLKHENWHGIHGVASDYPSLPKDGDVLLFHDRHWRAEKKESLRALVKLFKEKGYTFGKLSELLPKPAPTHPPH